MLGRIELCAIQAAATRVPGQAQGMHCQASSNQGIRTDCWQPATTAAAARASVGGGPACLLSSQTLSPSHPPTQQTQHTNLRLGRVLLQLIKGTRTEGISTDLRVWWRAAAETVLPAMPSIGRLYPPFHLQYTITPLPTASKRAGGQAGRGAHHGWLESLLLPKVGVLGASGGLARSWGGRTG